MRDDFSQTTKDVLARRVNYLCSNPDCPLGTVGPHTNSSKTVNKGVAAHITAAAPGGKRFDSSLTPEERKHEFADAHRAFDEYVRARDRLAAAVARVGIQTPNVDPLSTFAEVIVAEEFNGVIQPAANRGFDVVSSEGSRMQVKALRVSRSRPKDNDVSWILSTRRVDGREAPLIDADELAVVVYLDFRPYALAVFPVRLQEVFPVIEVKNMYLHHVERLLNGQFATEESGVSIKRLS